MNNMQIEDYIRSEMTSPKKDAALDFVAFLRSHNLHFHRDTGSYWKDKIYYWVQLGNECVCFISIKNPEDAHKQWTVWSDNMGSEWLEQSDVDDQTKESAWKHVDHCGHCGSCSGGKPKVIFGKQFNCVCGCTFVVDDPGFDDLGFLKKMVEIRILEIRDR